MSASRTPHLPHATDPHFRADDPTGFTAHPLRIGIYQLWFAVDPFDALDGPSDSVTVCVELGEPIGVDLEAALHLMLGLSLDLPAASRGSVVLHPSTGRLIYRFAYVLDDDPAGTRLVNAIAALATPATPSAHLAVH